MPKEQPPEVESPAEVELEETIDFLIIIESFFSGVNMAGMDQRYGVLNKTTGVVELRFGAHHEALQGLMLLQEAHDKHMTEYKRKMGMLN